MLGAERHTARRWGEGAKDALHRRTFTSEEFVVYGSPQPLKPTELQVLEGELRSRAQLKFYTEDKLTPYGPGQRADEVLVDGAWYEVHGSAAHGAAAPLPGGKYILASSERGEGDA